MNFRIFYTSSEKEVFGGKTAESNEELIKQADEESIVLHTKEKGSPFVEIKGGKGKISKKDIYEAGVFCAVYSQDWKKNRKDVIIHIFKGSDIYKEKMMNTGTFGVKKFKEMKIKTGDILKLEEELKKG